MPAISLVIVTNGPELIAGSTFIFRKRIGAVDPMTAETHTDSTIPKQESVQFLTCYLNPFHKEPFDVLSRSLSY